MNCYLANVKNSVFRNLRHHLRSSGEFRNIAKEKFLRDVIAYCENLLADPNEPKIKRKRIRYGKRYVTK